MQYQRSKIKRQGHKPKLKNYTLWFAALFFGLWFLNFLGCATVPNRQLNLPVFSIGGVKYMPLVSYCELKNIEWDYDTFTKTVTLKKDPHQVNLAVGSSLVIVDGAAKDYKQSVDLHNGAVVVPYRFKADLLDMIFKEEVQPKGRDLAVSGRFRKIVIDAGHGGKDPGATGRGGLREKDVVLDIAKKLNYLLTNAGYDTILTRDRDNFISLSSRACLANQARADLFVSIHANANRSRGMSGLEVYYVSPELNDSDRALVTAENADPGKEVCPFDSSLDVKATVWDMIYTSNRVESMDLAKYICNQARISLPTRVIGIKGAPFYVLKMTQMPALLVEVGFVSNSREEKMLKSILYRQQLAETIARAVEEFCRDYALIEAKGK